MVGVVVWAGDSDDAYYGILAKRLLIKEARAAGVKVFGENVKTAHGDTLIPEPVAQGQCRTVCPLTAHYM